MRARTIVTGAKMSMSVQVRYVATFNLDMKTWVRKIFDRLKSDVHVVRKSLLCDKRYESAAAPLSRFDED